MSLVFETLHLELKDLEKRGTSFKMCDAKEMFSV
jgi:hypothetical protein